MFVQYFTHVPVGLGTVEGRLDRIRTRLEEWAGLVYREGEELRAKVGPGINGYAKTVRVDIGLPEIRPAGLVYPVTWTATGAEALFPRLSAELILTHLGPDKTKLSVQGTYQPPLGPIGRAVDRLLLKNVAEATIQDWVDRVAEAVTSTEEVS